MEAYPSAFTLSTCSTPIPHNTSRSIKWTAALKSFYFPKQLPQMPSLHKISQKPAAQNPGFLLDAYHRTEAHHPLTGLGLPDSQ
ncbi:hypothetical protein Nepgr_016391 [Nepenthes gracilis]|uniref:Uncharacterized protein n=1 Tax=Nepenthes gracilis TaxID=150966 RepID=A0AAD3XSG3_NEPGR|nr:hypothetical protein Nepgr_016391 [Nepenthes gracilis]